MKRSVYQFVSQASVFSGSQATERLVGRYLLGRKVGTYQEIAQVNKNVPFDAFLFP